MNLTKKALKKAPAKTVVVQINFRKRYTPKVGHWFSLIHQGQICQEVYCCYIETHNFIHAMNIETGALIMFRKAERLVVRMKTVGKIRLAAYVD